MRFSDLIVGLVVLCGAAALYAAASTFPPIPGQAYGADVFPRLTALGFAVCGVLLCAGAVRAGARPLVAATWVREPGAALRALGTVVVVAGYLLLAPALGFVLTAGLALVALFLMVRVRPVVALPVAAGVALFTYYAFAHLLRVPLPRGFIEGFV